MATLDVDSVEAFVAIADLKSFTRAAKALGTTQGAINVKLKRLEDRLGQRLIERTPRAVRLSAQGAVFIESARDFLAAHERAVAGLSACRRRFTLGIANFVAGPEVPTLLARLNAHDPALTIEVRLDTSRDVLAAFDRGELDAAIIDRNDARRDGEVRWDRSISAGIRHAGFRAPDRRAAAAGWIVAVLRPAKHRDPCARRRGNCLDGGLPGLRLLCRCRRGRQRASPPRCSLAGLRHQAPSRSASGSGFPPIPSSEIVLLSTLSDAKSREALRTLATAFREHR